MAVIVTIIRLTEYNEKLLLVEMVGAFYFQLEFNQRFLKVVSLF